MHREVLNLLENNVRSFYLLYAIFCKVGSSVFELLNTVNETIQAERLHEELRREEYTIVPPNSNAQRTASKARILACKQILANT